MKYSYLQVYNELWSAEASGVLSECSPLINGNHPYFEYGLAIRNRQNGVAPVVILPDLSAYLILHFLTDGSIRTSLVGPRTTAVFIDRQWRSTTYLFRFRTGSLFALGNIPLTAFTNRSFRAEEVLNWKAGDMNTPGIEWITSGLWQKVSPASSGSHLKKARLAQAFLDLLTAGVEKLTVEEASRRLGVSNRYLQKVANEQLGLSPKEALQIHRFVTALHHKEQAPEASSAQLACRSGYYDQSHMISSFQRFLGLSPGNIW